MKDDDTGRTNASAVHHLGRGTVAPLAGRILRLSACVKQIAASSPDAVGISLEVKGEDGRLSRAWNWTGTTESTDWLVLQVKTSVPSNAVSARVALCCAHGWGQTGEAQFKDIVVSADAADHLRPQPVVPEASCVHAYALPSPDDTPEEAAFRLTLREQPPQEEDGRERPEMKNGTWYSGGRPVHYLGVWLYPRDSEWGPKSNPLGIDHPAYVTPPGAAFFRSLGFNSSQVSSAPGGYGACVRGLPFLRDGKKGGWLRMDDDFTRFLGRFDDMPLVVDFAFGYDTSYPKEAIARLDQCKTGSVWHKFVPFCPHVPEGWRYYRDYFLGGTRALTRAGGNVFLYELFNESAWNDMCRYAVRRFARTMEKRYGTIAAANAVWGACFDDFDDLAAQVDLKQFPGVWYDWCRFSSRSYCELLRRGIETVRAADRRRNIYFTEQESGTPSVHRGVDYRDVADTLDVLAIEGGWQYGFKTDFKARDDMEAVVATSRSRHFFNCDFFQALAKGRKPVMNDEHYCTRFEDGKRVPSHRTDYITSLWLEVMHGVSGSFFYVWDKRAWEARTPEAAHENVVMPSYKSSSLLNPYNVRPEDLCAFKMFRDELEPYRDAVLPFPRTKPASVAVFYSKATEIHRDAIPGSKTRPGVSDWYATLIHANFPCRVVFDEDIAGLGPEVEALVFPGSQSCSPATVAATRDFSQRGGLVLADEEAFRYDEYMKPVPPETSFVRVKDPSSAVARLLSANVVRYGVLVPADGGGPIAASDVQIIDRGDFKLVCCVAMQETAPRRALLRLSRLLPGTGAFRVWDPIQKKSCANGEKEDWSLDELAKGVPIDLPPQERVIRVLTASARNLKGTLK